MATVIEPIRADDHAAMDGWFDLTLRCQAHDTPDLPRLSRRRHALRLSSPGFERRAWAVRDGTEIVAAAEVALPLHDNLDNGFADGLVAPDRRRRGLGTQLLAHLVADARAAGRARLALQASEGIATSSPGSGFLRAAGARLGQVEMRRRLVLPAVDPRALRDLAASARRAARGYRLVQWTGPTPPDRRTDLAGLIARMSTDAPQGDFTLEGQRWDAERVRRRDAAAAAAGEGRVVTAAQAADGRLVAYTETAVPPDEDDVARQDDTLVAAEHRGHRLGLWIKLANLDQLADTHPEVRAVDTWNADGNRWMIAINDAMGFVPISRVTDWELDLTRGQSGTTAAISAAASGP
jgi:GNAT superfamily N-acetyltransferase